MEDSFTAEFRLSCPFHSLASSPEPLKGPVQVEIYLSRKAG